MQMPGSIAAANLPCDDRPSDAAFGHVVFGRNAMIASNIAEGPKRPDGCVTKVLKYSAGGIATRRARPIRVIVDPLPLA